MTSAPAFRIRTWPSTNCRPELAKRPGNLSDYATTGMSEEGELRKSGLSEGLVIAGVPLAAYVVTYAYQAGYAGFFGLPRELMPLSLRQVLIVATVLLLVVGLLWNIPRLIYLFRPPLSERKHDRTPTSAVWRRLQVPLILIALYVPFLLLFGPTRGESIAAGIMVGAYVVLYGFFVFLLPWITDRNRPYLEKIEKAERNEREDPSLDLRALDALEKRLGTGGVIALFVFVGFTMRYFVSGLTEGATKL